MIFVHEASRKCSRNHVLLPQRASFGSSARSDPSDDFNQNLKKVDSGRWYDASDREDFFDLDF